MRYALPGRKPRDMGLGSLEDLTLADAREKARDARALLREGRDPIDARSRGRHAADGRTTTFRQVAEAYVAVKRAEWKNEKHQAQWLSTLETYAFPFLGDMPVSDICGDDVLAVLEPIWTVKTETASRVRGRIEKILNYAKAKKLRTGENPAIWKDSLEVHLSARGKIAPVEHHPAMDWRECPAFMAALAGRGGASAQALRFTMLTAAQPGMTIGATWKEIDNGGREWVIPGARMKGVKGRSGFYVALSEPALEILEKCRLPDARPEDEVFPGDNPGSGLSNMAMLTLLDRMGRSDVTVHGFRSSFRDWAALRTKYPREVVETALAHTNKDKVEAAYLRTPTCWSSGWR